MRRALAWLGYTTRDVELPTAPLRPNLRWPLAFCAIYLLIQCVVPLRHWCYPGEVNWTEEGHNFSWHMKLRDKEGVIAYTVEDRATGKRVVLDSTQFAEELTSTQIHEMGCKPGFAAQYARNLREVYRARGFAEPAVFAEMLVSLDGRPFQPMVDPTVDLSAVHDSPWQAATWILPLDLDLTPGLFPPPPSLDGLP